MSVSSRPYKSRLFNFLNRQSLQIRDRVGETFRHLKIAAEWGAQLLISPLYWIFQPKWTGPVFGKGASDKALPASLANTYLSDPQVDQPIENVLNVIAPLFELPNELPDLLSLSATNNTVNPENSTHKKQIVLSAQFFEQVQQQIEASVQLKPVNSAFPPSQNQKALPAYGLNQLRTQVKKVLSLTKPTDLIIHGIACVRNTRQLVLTTTDNEVLDVLSLDQQQALNQSIRTEMANYWYERRLQWSIGQKFLGFIPLADQQTESVLPPIQLLWKTLHWLENQGFSPKLQALQQSHLIPATPSILPRKNALIHKLDQRVAALENQELKLSQQVFQQLNQGLQSVRGSQLIVSSLEKTEQLIQQIAVPQPLQRLNAEFLARVSGRLTKINLSSAIAKSGEKSNPLVSPNAIEASEPDPFQIQILIQAAIAYFFGQSSASSSLSGQNKKSLVRANESIDDPWLTWEDLFIDKTTEVEMTRSAETFPSLPLRGVPRRPALKSGKKSHQKKTKSRQHSQTSRSAKSPLSKTSVPTSTATRNESPTISRSEAILQDEIETALISKNPLETGLESAPDWIETEAKTMGYLKHPLERILEWLDLLVLWFEETFKNIWYWLQHRLHFKS